MNLQLAYTAKRSDSITERHIIPQFSLASGISDSFSTVVTMFYFIRALWTIIPSCTGTPSAATRLVMIRCISALLIPMIAGILPSETNYDTHNKKRFNVVGVMIIPWTRPNLCHFRYWVPALR